MIGKGMIEEAGFYHLSLHLFPLFSLHIKIYLLFFPLSHFLP